MRRYLPCGERFVMSLATVAKTKTRCFRNTYESYESIFAVKIAGKTTALPSFFSDMNMALFDFLNSQSILLASFNFADL